ncbi:MAG: hypothetical protein WAW17_31375 [Rhodococcus sp. (in: high G+C Gram-positive bacteria)]|uniref:hypothetical protein n=1 Tax=Rhodococcus sp. TaxID=1831 RepID=UPI003BB015C9
MTTGVGLTVGDSISTAVVVTTGADVRTIEHPSVLFAAPDGTVQLGDPGPEPAGSVRNFLARVGEPAGIEYAGTLTRAEDLVATAMFCLFREAAEGLSGAVKVTATHPSDWSPEYVTKLRESLDYMGLNEAALVPESAALAAVPDSAVPTSATHGAALLAAGLTLTHDDTQADTESIPVVVPPVHTAYSAIAEPAATPPASPSPVAPADGTNGTDGTDGTGGTGSTNRRPLYIAGAAAAILVAGGLLAFVLTDSAGTAVPVVQDARTGTTTAPTTRLSPTTTVRSTTAAPATTTVIAPPPRPAAPPPRPVQTTTVAPSTPPATTTTVTITIPPTTTVVETTTPKATTTTTTAKTTTTATETDASTTTTVESDG